MVFLNDSVAVNKSKLELLGLPIHKNNVENVLTLLKNIAKEKILAELSSFTMADVFSENSYVIFKVINEYFAYTAHLDYNNRYFNYNGLNLDKFNILEDSFIKAIAPEFKRRHPSLIFNAVVTRKNLMNAYAYYINYTLRHMLGMNEENNKYISFQLDRQNFSLMFQSLKIARSFNFEFKYDLANNMQTRKNDSIMNMFHENNSVINASIRDEVYSMILSDLNNQRSRYANVENRTTRIEVMEAKLIESIPLITFLFTEIERIKFHRTNITI